MEKRGICLHSSDLEVNDPSGAEQRKTPRNNFFEEKVEATSSLSTAFQQGLLPCSEQDGSRSGRDMMDNGERKRH